MTDSLADVTPEPTTRSVAVEPKELPELAAGRPRHLPRTFDAFLFGPFRWYMGAMIWWNAAMSMQMLVRGYLAYHLTDSFAALGVVGLGTAVPMLVLSPVGGVIADRTSKRFVLQIGQTFSLLISVVVATLIFSDVLAFWHLFVASLAQGMMVALVMPSRQALLPQVVGMRRLMNAIPLQTAGMNLMQILAPAGGGFMIDWLGSGWVYVFMAVMYAMAVVMLFFIQTLTPEELEASRTTPSSISDHAVIDDPEAESRSGTLGDLLAGFRYLRRDRTVLSILAFSFVGSMLGMPIRLLLPGYVGAVFGDEGSTLGVLQMGMGLGALVGALGLASLRMARHRGLLLAGSSVLVGVSTMAFSLSDAAWVAWLMLVVVGIGSAGRMAMGQVLVQEYLEDSYRGRVMSIYMMQFSLMSVGTFIAGLYMELVGPHTALASLGVLLVVATTAFLVLVPRFRNLD